MRISAAQRWTSRTFAPGPFSRVHRMRMAGQLVLLALVVSCTDRVTAPAAPGDAAMTAPLTIAPEIEAAVFHRTIEMDGITAAGASARIVQRRTFVQQLRELPHGQVSAALQAGAQPWSSGPAGVLKLPMPIATLPARLQRTACGNEPSWTRTMPLAALPGATIVATGAGDAPATLIRIVQNGHEVATVTRSWVRMARSWELTRQETTMPARNYRDVIEVERRPPAGGTVRTPLPVFACVANDSIMRVHLDRAVDPFGVRRATDATSATLTLLAPHAPREMAECVSDGYGDDCAAKRDELGGAEIELAGAIVAAAVVCSVPQPLIVPSCALAVSAYAKALGNYYVKRRALERCVAEQEARKEACSCAGGTALESRATEPGMVAARMSRALSPSGSATYLDCSGYDPYGPTGGTGAQGRMVYGVSEPVATAPSESSGASYHLCVYEVDYDLDTGASDIYVLYCYTVNMT